MTRRPLYPPALAWLAGILILASGCMDQSPTAALLDSSTEQRASVPAGISAVRAAAQYEAGTISQLITPSGGSIDFGIGAITFPKGAVDRATVITATVDGESMAVAFGPHLVFGEDRPTLCFNVAGIDVDGIALLHIQDDGSESAIAYVVDGGQLCARPGSFSQFVLASE